jgi:predicted O-methyltransferase YrrM
MDADLKRLAEACRGFMDEAEGLRLHDLACEHARLGPVLEVGSYCGKSAIYLGAGAKAASGTLVCIDHHRGSEENQPGWEYHDAELWDDEAGAMDTLPWLRGALRRADLEDTAVVIVCRSARMASYWTTPLGMLFIDGGHTLEAANSDYECWADKIVSGGILAIHDLFPNPEEGGQAPIEIYRRALASGRFDELETTKTLGVLRRR